LRGSSLAVAARDPAGAARARIELDHETVAPAVFALRARLDVAHQRGRRLGPHHTRAADEICRADPPPRARPDQEALHPVGAKRGMRAESRGQTMPKLKKPRVVEPIEPELSRPDWIVICLALAGVAVAGYLTALKLGGTQAFLCRDGSGCDVVQASRYSVLAG